MESEECEVCGWKDSLGTWHGLCFTCVGKLKETQDPCSNPYALVIREAEADTYYTYKSDYVKRQIDMLLPLYAQYRIKENSENLQVLRDKNTRLREALTSITEMLDANKILELRDADQARSTARAALGGDDE